MVVSKEALHFLAKSTTVPTFPKTRLRSPLALRELLTRMDRNLILFVLHHVYSGLRISRITESSFFQKHKC